MNNQPPERGRYEVIDAKRTFRRNPRRGSMTEGAPVSIMILVMCLLVFVIFNVVRPDLLISITFSPANGLIIPGILSHMFAHGDLMHLLSNMFVLFFLGITVERHYGSARYAVLFFASGLIAAVAQSMFVPEGVLLGASGALAGVMAAYLRHYPKVRLYLYGVLPLPAWFLLGGWMAYNIYAAQSGVQTGVAFVAHIAGFFAGVLVSLILIPPGWAKK